MAANFAMYKRIYNANGTMKEDKLFGSVASFENAVAMVALTAHNTLNNCVGSFEEIPDNSYRYFIYETDENGNFDVNKPLYKTEMYCDIESHDLKVYEVKHILNEVYCSDGAVVAAINEADAYKLVADTYTADDWYQVISFEHAMEEGKIREIADLHYNGNEHKIISRTFYVE